VSGSFPAVTDLDSRADRGAVGLLADQLHRQPVIVLLLTGVLEQNVVVPVAGVAPTFR